MYSLYRCIALQLFGSMLEDGVELPFVDDEAVADTELDSESAAETVLESASEGDVSGSVGPGAPSDPERTALSTPASPTPAPASNFGSMLEDGVDYGGWSRRAEEELSPAAPPIELPLEMADEGPADGGRGITLADIAALASRRSGYEARSSGLQAREHERARRSRSFSGEWELRTGGAVRAWLPRIGQD